jgi:hypothetical protein
MGDVSTYVGEGINVEPGENGDVGPWIFLPLYNYDVGDPRNRTIPPEYSNRQPACASQFTRDGITITIQNSGVVISDPVILQYQLRYCVETTHGVATGFATAHAGEAASKLEEAYLTLDVVPPGQSILKKLFFPAWPGYLANLYFRARVSTIWSPPLPPDNWDFANDPKVAEVYLRIAP